MSGTSAAVKHVTDLSEQEGHVAQLGLPGLTEDVQVLFGYLAGGVEGQGLSSRDDLSMRRRGGRETSSSSSSRERELNTLTDTVTDSV